MKNTNLIKSLVILISLISLVLTNSIDKSSFSNIDQIKQSKIAFDFNINFDKQM